MGNAVEKGWRRFIVTDKSFYKRVLIMVIPVVLQACINQGVNMMDTIMVGKLGEVAISASSLANQYYSLFNILCLGLSAAGLVLSSQYWGAGEKESVHRVFDLVIQIAVMVGSLFAIITALFPEFIMSIYTNEPDVIEAGAGYLRVTALIFLPHGISLLVANVMRSIGNTKLGLITSICSFVFNIFFNYIFIFGKLGMPALGVTGAAVGTLCSRVIEFAVTAVYVLKIEKDLKYTTKKLLHLPGKMLFSEFRRLGLPAVISDSLLGLANTGISIIIGHMGKEFVSAYAIVSVVDRLCTVAIAGVTSVSGVIIGHTVGEGDIPRARKEGYTFFASSIVIGIIGMALVKFAGTWSIGFYDIAQSTVEVTKHMMNASALITLFQTTQSCLSKGILRGGGDTKFLMVADILFMWCLSIPFGALAGLVFKWPPFWVLVALRSDYFIKSVWLITRLSSGKWIHKAKKIED